MGTISPSNIAYPVTTIQMEDRSTEKNLNKMKKG